MTVQELCDELTFLCHEGYAQAKVVATDDGLVVDVKGVEKISTESVQIVKGFEG